MCFHPSNSQCSTSFGERGVILRIMAPVQAVLHKPRQCNVVPLNPPKSCSLCKQPCAASVPGGKKPKMALTASMQLSWQKQPPQQRQRWQQQQQPPYGSRVAASSSLSSQWLPLRLLLLPVVWPWLLSGVNSM